MPKIAIDLLPIEFRAEEIKSAKFYKIQAFGIAVILLMIFLSTVVVALRILQSQNIAQVQNKVTASTQRISEFADSESLLILLKNRLAVINQYFGTTSSQTQAFILINKLVPPGVLINSISLEKGGDVLVLAQVSDYSSLDTLITNLTSQESNEGKISQVSLENINRGRDGVYRISLKIKPK